MFSIKLKYNNPKAVFDQPQGVQIEAPGHNLAKTQYAYCIVGNPQ